MNGINGNHFFPCGSGQKYKACCTQLVDRLVGCLEACTYAGSIETTKNKAKLPLSFKLSPVFQIEAELSEKETRLVKEMIRTHPTIVNRLYLISAKEIAQAYAESEHARYLLNLIYDLEEEATANREDLKNDKRPLNEREKQHFVENKITVPTHAESMRNADIEWLAPDRFVLV